MNQIKIIVCGEKVHQGLVGKSQENIVAAIVSRPQHTKRYLCLMELDLKFGVFQNAKQMKYAIQQRMYARKLLPVTLLYQKMIEQTSVEIVVRSVAPQQPQRKTKKDVLQHVSVNAVQVKPKELRQKKIMMNVSRVRGLSTAQRTLIAAEQKQLIGIVRIQDLLTQVPIFP